MTGGEIVAIGKAAEALGQKALGEDAKTKDVLLRVAEGTPEMTAAARSFAARTAVKERIKLKFYQPFARMVGVSKEYFEDTFPQEMAAKIFDIPEENQITPAPVVAVPALQGLSYSFEEPNLKELYLNLLTAASDDRRAEQAHPAFAEIIKQLAPREAKLLSVTLGRHLITAARLKNVTGHPPGAFIVLMSHLLPLMDETTGQPMEEPHMRTWVENWQRLGLVNATYTERHPDDQAYAWVQERPEYARFAEDPSVTTLDFVKGLLRRTDFGEQFFQAVT
jgi:hypothetical protein